MEILKNANFIRNLIIFGILLLSTTGAFGLGRLSILMKEKEEIVIDEIEMPTIGDHSASVDIMATETPEALSPEESMAAEPKAPDPTPATVNSINSNEVAQFVASKTGTRYYYPWCGTVRRIKEENKVYFNSRAEAEKAGLTPGNCAGMDK